MSAINVSAYGRQYTFHMNTPFASDNSNCVVSAVKGDIERKSYITMTKFDIHGGSPEIAMWVAAKGSCEKLTDVWTWRSTAPPVALEYHPDVIVKSGIIYQLCAEQFGNGSVTFEGRWAP